MSSLSANTATTNAAAPTTAAATQSNRRAIIFCHGLGDTPSGWSQLKQNYASELEDYDIKWIFPASPTAPVTISGGARQTSWFDIFDWPIGLSARDDPSGLENSVQILTQIIQDCEKDGILPEHIVLGGFSQGAAIALLTTWRYPRQLGGCVALSGWLTLKDDFAQKKFKENNTPLFWGHGTQDPVVLPEQVPVGVALIQDNGISVTQEMYPGMGHSSCPQEMNAVLGFIKTCFA